MKGSLLSLFILSALIVSAQTHVKNFTLKDVTSGADVSLESYSSSPGLVVVFTSNECPFDAYYAERLASLIENYSGKVPVLLINAHLNPEESEEKMKEKASAWPFRVPYLADKNQMGMHSLGARRSPEAFLLKSVKGNFEILYHGAIDDNPQEAAAVTATYLRNAINSLLAGKPVTQNHERTSGCSIRKK